MICINRALLIKDRIELNGFIESLYEEIYDEESKLAMECVAEFLLDVWERDEKATAMIHKKLSEDFYPMVRIDVEETANLEETRITLFCFDENYTVKKRDMIAFDRLCERYFRSLKSLYRRFEDLGSS